MKLDVIYSRCIPNLSKPHLLMARGQWHATWSHRAPRGLVDAAVAWAIKQPVLV